MFNHRTLARIGDKKQMGDEEMGKKVMSWRQGRKEKGMYPRVEQNARVALPL